LRSPQLDLFPPAAPPPVATSLPAAPPKDRTWWRLDGDEVVIRGQSPLMVWFTRHGESALAQQTMPLGEFLKRARPIAAPEGARS
jgi:hypothetical protein